MKFTVFLKSGGGEDVQIVDKYWKIITSIFEQMSEEAYSPEIAQFHIELRANGDFFSFGDKEGCNNLRFRKNKKIMLCSISFGKDIYNNENKLSDFLQDNLLTAFELMFEKLVKNKVFIDKQKTINDLKYLIRQKWIS